MTEARKGEPRIRFMMDRGFPASVIAAALGVERRDLYRHLDLSSPVPAESGARLDAIVEGCRTVPEELQGMLGLCRLVRVGDDRLRLEEVIRGPGLDAAAVAAKLVDLRPALESRLRWRNEETRFPPRPFRGNGFLDDMPWTDFSTRP